MRKQNFIASVNNEYLDHIENVARALRERGCEITQILKITGVITGKVNGQVNLNDLKIDGITSVEKQRVMKKS